MVLANTAKRSLHTKRAMPKTLEGNDFYAMMLACGDIFQIGAVRPAGRYDLCVRLNLFNLLITSQRLPVVKTTNDLKVFLCKKLHNDVLLLIATFYLVYILQTLNLSRFPC